MSINKQPGRPRDEATRIRILRSAVAILSKQGYRNATMNAIALKSGAGKQTLYRWWKNRAELLMEALVFNAEEHVDAQNDTSVESFLKNTFALVNANCGEILRSLVAEGIADKNLFHTFFNAFITKRQEALRTIIRKKSSVTGRDTETADTLIDIIFGAMWYRIIFKHRPLDDKLAVQLASIRIRR
jgi:AcrR family transcriptional regulator